MNFLSLFLDYCASVHSNSFQNILWNLLLHLPGNVLGNSISKFIEQDKDCCEVSNLHLYQSWLLLNVFSWFPEGFCRQPLSRTPQNIVDVFKGRAFSEVKNDYITYVLSFCSFYIWFYFLQWDTHNFSVSQ